MRHIQAHLIESMLWRLGNEEEEESMEKEEREGGSKMDTKKARRERH